MPDGYHTVLVGLGEEFSGFAPFDFLAGGHVVCGRILGELVNVLVGLEVVDGDDPLADHVIELALERFFVVLAEPWVVVDEVGGNPSDARGLVGGARVNDVDECLPGRLPRFRCC